MLPALSLLNLRTGKHSTILCITHRYDAAPANNCNQFSLEETIKAPAWIGKIRHEPTSTGIAVEPTALSGNAGRL
jgi:hypothetical protein